MDCKSLIYQHTVNGPIKEWHQGLMVGNGFFGALIYGEKDIVFSLDRIDLWDNRLTPEMKSKQFTYHDMVRLMKADWDEYLRLFDGCYNHPYPTKLNAGSIVFDNQISKRSRFCVDIKRAEYKVKSLTGLFDGYLDANKDVLIINYPKGLTFSFKMPEYLSRKTNGLSYPIFKEYTDKNFRYIIQETPCNYNYGIVSYNVKGQLFDTLFVTVFKSDECSLEDAKSLLVSYSKEKEIYKKEHSRYWRRYFNHALVFTGDEKIDRTYNFGRYFFACNSRRKYPMSLEGVWTRNDGNLPPWKGDYHMDINLQMSYESYMKTGDFKEGKVLVDYLWNNRTKFKKLAKKFCNADGYFIPGVMSQNCTPLGGWPMYALNPCNSIWISSSFDNYYRYTGNKSFLKNRAFPFFSNIEKCISSLLVEKDGHLQFEFSASPEINDCNKNSILDSQSNFELSTLHYLYRTLVEYSKILGLDSNYYLSRQSNLRDYLKNINGETMISKKLEYSISHRHFSHILSHKNFENVLPYDQYNQIFKDYNRLINIGTSEWAGFSFTEASSLASYLCLGEDAYKFTHAFVDGFINDNCFHMNMDYNHKGYSELQSYAFTLEANVGFVRSITDMMIRTSGQILTIFPAIAKKLSENHVYFKKLTIFNNHKVSGEIKHNKLSFSIKMNKPDTIKIFNNIGEKFTLIIDGTEKEFVQKKNDIFEVSALKSIEYLGK